MIYKPSFILHGIFISFIIYFSSYAMETQLEIFPEVAKEVTLPFKYYSPTDEDRKKVDLVWKGNRIDLKNKGDCALVEVPYAGQVMVLQDDSKKVTVGSLDLNANLGSFITHVQNRCKKTDISKITGTLFTNKVADYGIRQFLIDNGLRSWKDLYEGRTQLGELAKNKNQIVDACSIKDRRQIRTVMFSSNKSDAEFGNYWFAQRFLFVKHVVGGKPEIYNTCPMAENIFGEFLYDSLALRAQMFESIIQLKNSQNPFYKQVKLPQDLFTYGALDFVEQQELNIFRTGIKLKKKLKNKKKFEESESEADVLYDLNNVTI